MKTYIYSISSITNQESFNNPGFSKIMRPYAEQTTLSQPIYKEFIPIVKLRRMPKLSRMAMATSLSVLKQANLENVGAIIAASGLGSLDDTERFLQKYIPAGDSLVPPVSFIQSGHNTVAGQIALNLKNHSYNMTHVQQNLSFEHALIDSLLYLEENGGEVLLGGMDEKISLLDELAALYKIDSKSADKLSEGCTFMIAGTEKGNALAEVASVEANVSDLNTMDKIDDFLERNGLERSDIDQYLIGSTIQFEFDKNDLPNTLVYTDFCGQYFTSSAFACHLAVDQIQSNGRKKVLIINGMANKLGLMLISNV